MELINQEEFLVVLNNVKNSKPEIYNDEKGKEYIDMEKAKNIIKIVMRNERLNQFLISGFIERYVEYVYKNREEIIESTLKENYNGSTDIGNIENEISDKVEDSNMANTSMPEGNFEIEMDNQEFKRIISKIVIDDVHLSDKEIKDGCDAYEMLKQNNLLNNKISYEYIKEYAMFIYYNRYQIRKLASKDLPKIKMDSEGNYILRDEDFVAKINADGGHNSPLWICIDVSDDSDGIEKVEEKNKKLRKIIEEKLYFFKNISETISENKTEKAEEKILRKQVQQSKDEYDDIVEVKEIKNDIVVKNLLKENERETALIAEEIARQLRFPVAQYYPAKYIGKMYTKEAAEERQKIENLDSDKDLVYVTERIVLTPNFLEQGEEFITGDRIAKYDMDVSVVPNLIREYFKKEGVEDKKIELLISDYRCVMAYNCLINHRDCHNGNWGYIKSQNGEYRISHIFDLEGSLDENKNNIRAIFVGDHFTSNGNNIDEYLLEELLQDKRCRERVRGFLELDLNKVFRNVSLSKGINIPKVKMRRVMETITKEKQIFVSVLKKLEQQERDKQMEDNIIEKFMKDDYNNKSNLIVEDTEEFER